MKKYHVGIDLHKTVIQVCVLTAEGEVVSESRHEGESLEAGLEVIEHLKRWRDGGRYVVEAVGMNRWFVNACRREGMQVIVADPGRLGLRFLGKKTDRRDAFELARRLALGDIDRNATTYYPTDKEYAQRKLLRARHKLVQNRQMIANQLRGLLNAYRMAPPRGRLWSGLNLAKLREYVMREDVLTFVFRQLVDALAGIEAPIKAMDQRIAECVAKDKALTESHKMLPQAGAQTALTIVRELGDVRRFQGPKQVAAYVGLVPRVADSGDRSHHGRLTKRGNAELRWILTQWAVRLMTKDPLVQDWAKPRLQHKHKNKVRMELARRLIVGVYIMLSRKVTFDLRRCLAAG